MSIDQRPFFLAKNEALREASLDDDFLHPKQNANVHGDSLTETQYLGISAPEHGIHGMGYLWHHPNLKVVSGGIWVFKGVNTNMLDSEMVDMRMFMSDRVLENDLRRYRLESGYGVEVVKPLEHLHLTYDDAPRGNRADLHYTAVTPPVMFGDGNHFEQTLRVRGELSLRGQTYKVDTYNVRDRSWGKLRSENPMTLPPTSWCTGAFNDDLSFNCNIFDHAFDNQHVDSRLAMPAEQALNGGWVWRNGRFRRIVKALKQARREPGSHVVRELSLAMTDEDGRTLGVRGQLVASSPWNTWPNTKISIGLMRWETDDGLVGHGDCQDLVWTDYFHASRSA